MLADALEMVPLRTRSLPCVSVEWLVETAQRPTVDLPNAPAPAPVAPKPVGLKGNGSPVIQPGYRLGLKPANAGRRYAAEVLTDQEFERLLAATPKTGGTGMRNRALYVLLWRTGLRISEALDLYPKDIDPARRTVTVLCGKGSKRRTVGIDAKAIGYVDEWLDWRLERLRIDRYRPVFCTVLAGFECRAINSSYVRRNLKRLGRRAGLDKRLHPHGLRHTLAAGLADELVDLRAIQRQLGHSNLATTARYVDHLTPGKALEAVQSRAWPGDDGEVVVRVDLTQADVERLYDWYTAYAKTGAGHADAGLLGRLLASAGLDRA